MLHLSDTVLVEALVSMAQLFNVLHVVVAM